MDQAILIGALGKHLDALSGLYNWVVGLALVSALAGLQKTPELSVLSLKFSRRQAFYIIALCFMYTDVYTTILFTRISFLLDLIDDTHIDLAVTTLAINAWPLNPFALFGSATLQALISDFGFVALVATSGLAGASLVFLSDEVGRKALLMILAAFLLIGLIAFIAIEYGLWAVAKRTMDLQPSLREMVALKHERATVVALVSLSTVVGPLFWAFCFARRTSVRTEAL